MRPARPGRPVLALVALAVLLLLGGSCADPAAPSDIGAGSAVRSATGLSRALRSAPATPSNVNVVALGDSVTTGGPCGCSPFPRLYAEYLAQDRGVRATTTNLGQDGLDSGGLLAKLRDPGSTEAGAVRSADVDLLTIGANDFSDQHDSVTAGRCMGGGNTYCIQDELSSMTSNVEEIIRTIHDLRGHRPTAILVTGYWNVFEDGEVARESFPDAGVRATRRLTTLANAGIREAARVGGATYVDLYAPFNGPDVRDTTNLLGPDGDHPNAAGQALIARRLVAAGLPGLAEG